jgi:hypothetical protein
MAEWEGFEVYERIQIFIEISELDTPDNTPRYIRSVSKNFETAHYDR